MSKFFRLVSGLSLVKVEASAEQSDAGESETVSRYRIPLTHLARFRTDDPWPPTNPPPTVRRSARLAA
jgi:hypothetical protein